MKQAPKRPDLYVVARFLDCLHGPTGETPSYSRAQLQRAVRLNYDLFCKYLDLLLERGYVASGGQGGRDVFFLTAAGHDAHARLLEWLRSLFSGARF